MSAASGHPGRVKKVIIVLLALAVVAGSVAIFLNTTAGKRATAAAITDAFNGKFQGKLQIGRLSEMGEQSRLHRVRLFAPDGALVATAKSCAITFAPRSLLQQGILRTKAVVCENGTIEVEELPNGDFTLEQALSSRKQGGTSTAGRLDLQNFVFNDFVIKLTLQDFSPMHFRNLHGIARIYIDAKDEPRIDLDKVRGRLDLTSPVPAQLPFHALHGRLAFGYRTPVDLTSQLRVADGTWNTRVQYHDRTKKPRIWLYLDNEGLLSSLAALGLKLGSGASSDLRVIIK